MMKDGAILIKRIYFYYNKMENMTKVFIKNLNSYSVYE